MGVTQTLLHGHQNMTTRDPEMGLQGWPIGSDALQHFSAVVEPEHQHRADQSLQHRELAEQAAEAIAAMLANEGLVMPTQRRSVAVTGGSEMGEQHRTRGSVGAEKLPEHLISEAAQSR